MYFGTAGVYRGIKLANRAVHPFGVRHRSADTLGLLLSAWHLLFAGSANGLLAPQRRDTSILIATGRNRVVPMPKGVVGIVSTWNYPLFLTMSPLTSVLAAGNRAMIKMASSSQHLCRLLAEKLRDVFS